MVPNRNAKLFYLLNMAKQLARMKSLPVTNRQSHCFLTSGSLDNIESLALAIILFIICGWNRYAKGDICRRRKKLLLVLHQTCVEKNLQLAAKCYSFVHAIAGFDNMSTQPYKQQVSSTNPSNNHDLPSCSAGSHPIQRLCGGSKSLNTAEAIPRWNEVLRTVVFKTVSSHDITKKTLRYWVQVLK